MDNDELANRRCEALIQMSVRIFTSIFPILLFILPPTAPVSAESAERVSWLAWGDDSFKKAKVEKKLLLLNLQAAWCHWCHVMDEETYANPEVMALLKRSFVTVAVQQDENPALSSRYRDSGWPATVIFDSNASELQVLSGFIEPQEFRQTLERLVANPKREPATSKAKSAKDGQDTLVMELLERYQRSLDREKGGLVTSHRYLDSDSIEYALRSSLRGGEADRTWLHLTLEANRALQDKTWGGVYQYSTGRQWGRPHFEKLLTSQWSNVVLYSMAHQAYDGGAYGYSSDVLKTSVFIKNFLTSPQGSFYVSQSADVEGVPNSSQYYSLGDAERRKLGIPKVDTHEYGRETSLGIEAMLHAYATTRRDGFLSDAVRAGEWLVSNRILPDGAVLHDKDSTNERYLADCVAAARALLRLFAITGDRVWFSNGERVLEYLIEHFRSDDGQGFVASEGLSSLEGAIKSLLQHVSLSENLATGRVANLYYAYSGKPSHRKAAVVAAEAVKDRTRAFSSVSEPGILLFLEELDRAPIHVTVVGDRGDPRADALWWEAVRIPDFYNQIERLSFSELTSPTDLNENKIRYPRVAKPAAFLCSNKTCSLPIFSPEELRSKIAGALALTNRKL